MGRHKEINQPAADMPAILPAVVARIEAAQDGLVVQDAAVKALAVMLGYEGGTSPDALENSAREAIRRMNMAVMEVGAYLLLLREQCVHGEFIERLGRLEMQPRVAQQYMQVTLRFSNANTYSHLQSIGKGKMVEMLVLDDQEITELVEGGNVRGITMDKIDGMSVRELRTALKESKAEAKANQDLIDHKNAKIDKLERQSKRIQAAPASEAQKEILRELSDLEEKAISSIQGGVRKGFDALVEHHVSHGGDSRQVMAGYVAQLQQMVNELRDDFNLPDTVGDGTPAWQVWADAQDSANAADAANH